MYNLKSFGQCIHLLNHHFNQDIKRFCDPKKFSCTPSHQSPHLSVGNCCPDFYHLFQNVTINGIMQSVGFWVWPLPLNIIFVNLSDFARIGICSFLLLSSVPLYECMSICWIFGSISPAGFICGFICGRSKPSSRWFIHTFILGAFTHGRPWDWLWEDTVPALQGAAGFIWGTSLKCTSPASTTCNLGSEGFRIQQENESKDWQEEESRNW